MRENIVVWPKNGIEYYYPVSALQYVYSCSPAQLDDLLIVGDQVSLNGVTKTKNDLATEVLRHINESTLYSADLTDKLLAPLAHAID